MIAAALVLLAVVALAPLAWTLRHESSAKGRRESALRIQRAQLAELDRDLEQGRIAPAEHATAKLEIQRRLLATAEIADPVITRGSPWPLLATLVLVPVLGVGLYAIDGHPSLPAAPFASRVAKDAKDKADAETLVASLRDRLAAMDQKTEVTRQGYVLLGNAENSLGHLAEAVDAWHKALAVRFDPGLGALTAEMQSRLEGRVSEESEALFRRALAEAPADAPWRKVVQDRLAEAKQQ